jgi:hypothetical protein
VVLLSSRHLLPGTVVVLPSTRHVLPGTVVVLPSTRPLVFSRVRVVPATPPVVPRGDVGDCAHVHRLGPPGARLLATMGRLVRPSDMRTSRLLALLVVVAASTLGGCYVDAGPPGPYYGRPPPPVVYGHTYEWHTYGRPPPPRY